MMSDFQKVRVTFKDADGRQVSAAMWGDSGGVLLNWPNNDVRPANYFYAEHGKDVEVTPIRELPTGVGAVIRMTGDINENSWTGLLFVRNDKGNWLNLEDVLDSDEVLELGFEVLSEGIQL